MRGLPLLHKGGDFSETDNASAYRLVTEGLGVKHLRLVIGNSMGRHAGLAVGHPLSGRDGCAAC